jgi:mannosyltransferase
MATVARRRTVDPADLRSLVQRPSFTPIALTLLCLFSLYLRTRILRAPLWLDEGLSVGIGSHPFHDIPSVLHQDGSPPVYYMLLHVWMSVFGKSESAIHLMSVVFAIACVPVAFWLADRIFDRRTAWIAAVLFAVNPFLTRHGQEARMYALVVLLSLLVTGCFVEAFVARRRRFLAGFMAAAAALLYTHNWAFFLLAGTALALAWLVRRAGAVERRQLLRDALIAYGATALLFLPWLSTFAFQARHTGAPWSGTPSFGEALKIPSQVLGGAGTSVALLLGAGSGLAAILAARDRARPRVIALITLTVTAMLAAWAANQASPAWASRYFAIFVPALLLLAGAGLARGGRVALAALALVVVSWGQPHGYSSSTVSERKVIRDVSYMADPGSLVIDTHPERAALISYYMPPHMRYADLFGFDRDPGVMDWRDAEDRLKHAKPRRVVPTVLDSVPPGGRVVLVRPVTRDPAAWSAPWTRLVKRRSAQWQRLINRDKRFVRVLAKPRRAENLVGGIRALVYERKRAE